MNFRELRFPDFHLKNGTHVVAKGHRPILGNWYSFFTQPVEVTVMRKDAYHTEVHKESLDRISAFEFKRFVRQCERELTKFLKKHGVEE